MAGCNWKDYEVLDTSNGEKLERWGNYLLVRPWTLRLYGTHLTPIRVGRKRTDIIIEAAREAVNGSFSLCHSSGAFIMESLPSS